MKTKHRTIPMKPKDLELAEALIPPDPNESHWVAGAQSFIAGCILWVKILGSNSDEGDRS